MSLGAIAFLTCFGLAILLIARWMGTANTEQEGFTALTSFLDTSTAMRAKEVLERAKIPVALDPHRATGRAGRMFGITRLLVAEDRIADAATILSHEASYVEPKAPPA